MEKIIKQVQEWQFSAQLPAEIAGFTLEKQFEQQGTQFLMFTYCNEGWHKSFSILYDTATKEYFGRIFIGLTEYFDANFIVNNLESLEKLLRNRLRATLTGLAVFDPDKLDSILIDKKILEWTYGKEMPTQVAGFELFIKPYEPVRLINGSYIIIDYSDFVNQSSFVIYYNIFRDEFFGELRFRRTPEMSAIFDSNDLEELEANITSNLQEFLKNTRARLS